VACCAVYRLICCTAHVFVVLAHQKVISCLMDAMEHDKPHVQVRRGHSHIIIAAIE
jgi:hypothetical protein